MQVKTYRGRCAFGRLFSLSLVTLLTCTLAHAQVFPFPYTLSPVDNNAKAFIDARVKAQTGSVCLSYRTGYRQYARMIDFPTMTTLKRTEQMDAIRCLQSNPALKLQQYKYGNEELHMRWIYARTGIGNEFMFVQYKRGGAYALSCRVK